MRIFKNYPLLSLVKVYLKDAPQPSNISYLWSLGWLLTFCLVIQIITGVTLAMHYNPSVAEAFNSIEHIMRDVNNEWLIRYLHYNTALVFLFLIYLHIGTELYFGSYKSIKRLVWVFATIILVLITATTFLGYVSPLGHISLFFAKHITNIISAIPWVGKDIVDFLWVEPSVNYVSMSRFFVLLFLPFILVALVLMHLIALHYSPGPGNPLGISDNYDRLPRDYYFLFKYFIFKFFYYLILLILLLCMLFLLFKFLLYLTPICYCMDEITEAKLALLEKISKIQDSYAYWKAQSISADLDYKCSLSSSDVELQKETLQAKKECERNLNQDSHLLRRLNEKLASGNYSFNNQSILGKRSHSE